MRHHATDPPARTRRSSRTAFRFLAADASLAAKDMRCFGRAFAAAEGTAGIATSSAANGSIMGPW
jgi:hypothetical protein